MTPRDFIHLTHNGITCHPVLISPVISSPGRGISIRPSAPPLPSARSRQVVNTFAMTVTGASPGYTFNLSNLLCRCVFLGNMPETALRMI
jgi:hypothetical protein